jgi:ElaB/YqjD/DUF883 family membrane-anchored ribosome-binding protein
MDTRNTTSTGARSPAEDTTTQLRHKVEDAASKVADQGREAGDRVQQVAGNMKSAVDKSVHDQPMATLAIAAVVGFVLGAIWKS